MNNLPLIVLVGETASGKSRVALEIARQNDGEIVSADAWSVYKKFDIGTAKPSPAEQTEILHHMIDITDARDGYSAALYKEAAQKVINDIKSRGRVPVLVGGSGLYIDSVLFDYSFLPAPTHAEREELSSLSLTELRSLAEERGYDLTGIDLRNKRRIIRLIENQGISGTKHELRQDALIFGITTNRETLQSRIETRVDVMIAAGLKSEVRTLAEEYGWNVEPMKGIGYREWHEYFNGIQTLQQTRDRIVAGTSRLAKKQRTWFRRNKSIQWENNTSDIVELVTTQLNKYNR